MTDIPDLDDVTAGRVRIDPDAPVTILTDTARCVCDDPGDSDCPAPGHDADTGLEYIALRALAMHQWDPDCDRSVHARHTYHSDCPVCTTRDLPALVRAVITTVTPLIRSMVAEEIADHRDGWASSHPDDAFGAGLETAEAIVRQRATQEETRG